MGRIIAAVALIGWTAIIAVAWKLADARISQCVFSDIDCHIRLTAQRDYILTVGLTGGLVIVVAALSLYALARNRQPGAKGWWVPANSGQRPRLR